MSFPFSVEVRVTNERDALALFIRALRTRDTACIAGIKAVLPQAQHWDTPIEDLDLTLTGYDHLKLADANTVAKVITMNPSPAPRATGYDQQGLRRHCGKVGRARHHTTRGVNPWASGL